VVGAKSGGLVALSRMEESRGQSVPLCSVDVFYNDRLTAFDPGQPG